jgi:hypothetical protein
MGGFEAVTPVVVEPSVEYHPLFAGILTRSLESGTGTLSDLAYATSNELSVLRAKIKNKDSIAVNICHNSVVLNKSIL